MKKLTLILVLAIFGLTLNSCSEKKQAIVENIEPKMINDTTQVLVGNPVITISGDPARIPYGESYTTFVIDDLKKSKDPRVNNLNLLDSLIVKPMPILSDKDKQWFMVNNEKVPYSQKLFEKNVPIFGCYSSYTKEEQFHLFTSGKGLCDQQRTVIENEIIRIVNNLDLEDLIKKVPNPNYVAPVVLNPDTSQEASSGLWHWLESFWNHLGPILGILALIALALFILWLLYQFLSWLFNRNNTRDNNSEEILENQNNHHTETNRRLDEVLENQRNNDCCEKTDQKLQGLKHQISNLRKELIDNSDPTTNQLKQLPNILKAAGEAAGEDGNFLLDLTVGDVEVYFDGSRSADLVPEEEEIESVVTKTLQKYFEFSEEDENMVIIINYILEGEDNKEILKRLDKVEEKLKKKK